MTAQPIPFEVSAPAKNIPEGMRRAILKGLSKDRDQRESSAREFFTDLSDGGRMTVEANPAETAAAARTGTAAMDAVPGFLGSAAQAAPFPGSPHSPTPMAVAAAPVPRAPGRTAPGGGGGKGLVFGLVGVAVVLLGAIGIVLIKSNKSDNTDLPPIAVNTAPPSTAAAGPAEIKPLDPVPPDPAPTADPAPASGGSPATTPGPKPTAGGTSKPTTPSTPTPPKPAGDPCDACKAAAASGNASGVQAALGRCTDAGKQAECKSTLSRTAVGAIQATARNGQCDRAKALVAAAEAAGVKGAARGLNGTSCK